MKGLDRGIKRLAPKIEPPVDEYPWEIVDDVVPDDDRPCADARLAPVDILLAEKLLHPDSHPTNVQQTWTSSPRSRLPHRQACEACSSDWRRP